MSVIYINNTEFIRLPEVVSKPYCKILHKKNYRFNIKFPLTIGGDYYKIKYQDKVYLLNKNEYGSSIIKLDYSYRKKLDINKELIKLQIMNDRNLMKYIYEINDALVSTLKFKSALLPSELLTPELQSSDLNLIINWFQSDSKILPDKNNLVINIINL